MAVCAESVSAGIGIGNSHLVAMEDKNGCWSHIVRTITKNVEKWGRCGKKFLQRPLFYAILRTLLKNTYVIPSKVPKSRQEFRPVAKESKTYGRKKTKWRRIT